MPVIPRLAASLAHGHEAGPACTADAWVSTAMPAGAGVGGTPGLRSPPPAAASRGATAARRCTRSPATRERLHRLRRELSRIDPPPGGPEQARTEIIDALARAGLQGWTVPGLDAAACRHADGSLRLDLLSHAVVINPWGAFRIVDLHAPAVAYFEMRGRDGRGFVAPQ